MATRTMAEWIRNSAMAATFCAMAAISASVAIDQPAMAQAAGGAVSDPQDVNGVNGVVAEIVQCKREAGVLSIRMRVRNTGGADAGLRFITKGNYDQYYVTAGAKKYFVLRDSAQTPLANPITSDAFSGNVDASIAKGGSFTWYAKYPAPPAEVKKINYYTPLTAPFEDIPVSD